MNTNQAHEVLAAICAEHNHHLSYTEAKEALQTLRDEDTDDFSFDLDGNEYRIIKESSIWEIYVEAIKDLVEDGFDLKLDKLPDFLAFAIDWEMTAKNCVVDGYGHTFSSYDGSEIETRDFYIFRTN